MKTRITNLFWCVLFIAGLPLLLASCVGEDRDDCDPVDNVRLGFRFDPETGHDMLADDITSMDVFIFDGNGLYVSTTTVSNPRIGAGAYITLHLEPGTYQFVAWGNLSCEHYSTNTTPIVGQTTVSELQLSFACPSHRTVDYTFDHLFNGSIDATVNALSTDQEVIIPVVQDTYTIEVAITSGPTDVEYRVDITDAHSDYTFRNEIIASDEIVFTSSCSAADSEPACIRTLKLTQSSTTTLSLYNNTTRSDDTPIYSATLIDLLNASGTFSPETKHTYSIELELTDANTLHTITIEDWKLVVDDDIPLGPQN